MEIWKDVIGYEGLYKVSNTGKVFSTRYNRLIGRIDYKGYYKVHLCKFGDRKKVFVHRLVAYAFIPKVEGKNCIDHIDGNPSNNCVENLRWCTHKENLNFPLAKINKNNSLEKFRVKVIMLDKNDNVVKIFNGVNIAERETGINRSVINGCLTFIKTRRNIDGYTFIYYHEIELGVLSLLFS